MSLWRGWWFWARGGDEGVSRRKRGPRVAKRVTKGSAGARGTKTGTKAEVKVRSAQRVDMRESQMSDQGEFRQDSVVEKAGGSNG